MTLCERIEEDRARIAQTELDTLHRVLTYAKRMHTVYKQFQRDSEAKGNMPAASRCEGVANAYSDIVAEIRSARNFLGNIPE